MTETSLFVFDTAIGPCAVVWGRSGILGLLLPEQDEGATRQRALLTHAGAREATPPTEVADAIASVIRLLAGEAVNLSNIQLDMENVTSFRRRTYEAARAIPPGQTLSYGELAARLGTPGAARAVGQALSRNPFAIIVPCHRVLAAGGKVGGFTANGGVETKLRMLAIERASARLPALAGDAAFANDAAFAAGRSSAVASERTLGEGTFPFDPRAAVAHLRAVDRYLCRVIDAVGPFRMELKQTSSLFAALAEAIVYQQLSGKAAGTIHARVCALFPRTRSGLSPRLILSASDEQLRGAGLSRAKMLALRDLAQKTQSRMLPTLVEAQGMTNDALVEKLTVVRGIGRWTVEMLLMFRLGRPDVLPVDDYGVRKGFALAWKKRELPAPSALAHYGKRWQPYRTVASWYLWRVLELEAYAKRAPSVRPS